MPFIEDFQPGGRYYGLPRRDEGIHIEDRTFIISADLGQANDFTAISILEKIIKGKGVLGLQKRNLLGYYREGELYFRLRHLERPPRGTEYPLIVDRLMAIFHSPQLSGARKAVVIDLTGVGRPVYDLMLRQGFYRSLNAITITAGNNVLQPWPGVYNVPKRDLVTNLQVMLQNDELKIARGIKEADALIEELTNFQVKITANGHDVYGGRSGVHDDLVLSVAMGAWLAKLDRCKCGFGDWM